MRKRTTPLGCRAAAAAVVVVGRRGCCCLEKGVTEWVVAIGVGRGAVEGWKWGREERGEQDGVAAVAAAVGTVEPAKGGRAGRDSSRKSGGPGGSPI